MNQNNETNLAVMFKVMIVGALSFELARLVTYAVGILLIKSDEGAFGGFAGLGFAFALGFVMQYIVIGLVALISIRLFRMFRIGRASLTGVVAAVWSFYLAAIVTTWVEVNSLYASILVEACVAAIVFAIFYVLLLPLSNVDIRRRLVTIVVLTAPLLVFGSLIVNKVDDALYRSRTTTSARYNEGVDTIDFDIYKPSYAPFGSEVRNYNVRGFHSDPKYAYVAFDVGQTSVVQASLEGEGKFIDYPSHCDIQSWIGYVENGDMGDLHIGPFYDLDSSPPCELAGELSDGTKIVAQASADQTRRYFYTVRGDTAILVRLWFHGGSAYEPEVAPEIVKMLQSLNEVNKDTLRWD